MTKQRKRYTPQQKMEILREHLKNKVPISEVCEKYGIHPNVFYKWEKRLFEEGAELFSAGHGKNGTEKEVAQVKKHRDKIQKKDEVIRWLTEENIKLKKTFGGD